MGGGGKRAVEKAAAGRSTCWARRAGLFKGMGEGRWRGALEAILWNQRRELWVGGEGAARGAAWA